MKVELTKIDLVNLVSATNPNSIAECINYEKKMLMTFSGNQHNESWTWNITELKKQTEGSLYRLYNLHKK